MFQSGQREIVIAADELLAPLARDFATSNRMKIIYGNADKSPSPAGCGAGQAPSGIELKIRGILEKDFDISDEDVLEALVQKIKVKVV